MSLDQSELSRRKFLAAGLATGSLLLSPGWLMADAPTSGTLTQAGSDELRVGIIGVGSQGRVLINATLKIPGVRFVAITDSWEYSRTYARRILEKFNQPVTAYEDYREMLGKEKLDAVLIATPDWNHAGMTVDCLEAGVHVYCEKEMSNTVEGARRMVLAARKTGKMLQIGHQRRSNPRYRHALHMINNDKILGRIIAINGQWNRPVQEPLGWPQKFTMDAAILNRFGYGSMEEYVNWRWYRKYSGGPIVDLGSHQIEVYNWFLNAKPTAVVASGGVDYYKDGREWYDNVMAIYEYATPEGAVRAFYQVLNTTSHGGYYETFMGDEGSLTISEDARVGHVFREAQAKKREWEDLSEKVEKMGREALELKIGETRSASGEKSPEVLKAVADLTKPEHQPHLENFFDAVRGKAKLNCPADIAYETCVTVLKVNEAVATGKRLEFTPGEFTVA